MANAALKDMEFTMVHELVHLELTSLTRNLKSRSEESFSKPSMECPMRCWNSNHDLPPARLQDFADASSQKHPR